MSGTSRIQVAWKAAWSDAAFRIQVVITLPSVVIILALFSHFIEWVEGRQGIVLHDPILAAIAPLDFTWPIFILIYAGLVIGLVSLSDHPQRLMTALQSYMLMVSVRFVAMCVTPLDPPNGIIPLVDPFVQFFGAGATPTKDLFFSGHTSTLLLLAFSAVSRRLKVFFALSAVVVAVLIVCQHVHYTVDVLVAPFVAYACYRLVVLLHHPLHIPGGS